MYSWLSLSRPGLSRITTYLEEKIWSLPKYENLTTCRKYCGKEEKLLLRSNFSSFPQYFQYISNLRVQLHIYSYLLNVVNRISFSSVLQIWYVEVRISRSISERPLQFEITRVDCNYDSYKSLHIHVHLLFQILSINNLVKLNMRYKCVFFFLWSTTILKCWYKILLSFRGFDGHRRKTQQLVYCFWRILLINILRPFLDFCQNINCYFVKWFDDA